MRRRRALASAGEVVVLALLLGCAAPPPPPSMDEDVGLKGWIEVDTPVFSIASSAERDRTLRLARDLEVFAAVVARTTSIERFRPRLPARIYLFADQESYGYFRAGRWAIGQMYASPRGFIMLMSPELSAARETLFHEYVHYLIRNESGLHYPVWYDEGLAEMLSTVRVREHLVTLGAAPSRASGLQSRSLLPMREVLGARSYSDLGRDLGTFYLQSWLVVHYFHAGHHAGFPRRLPQMRRYLSALNEGGSWEEAYRASFDVGIETLEGEVERYWTRIANGGFLPKVTLDTRKMRIGSELAERPLPPAQVACELGEIYLDYGDRAARYAKHLFERALEHDPDHAGALAGLAEAHASLGETEEAEVSLDRALADAPDDATVRRAEGDVLFARYEADGDRSDLDAARAAYRRSIELAPGLPAGYVQLGRTYLDDEGQDVAPGIDALRRAYAALPWDTSLSLDLAKLYLASGRPEPARAHLEEVLRWSHGDEQREEAESLLEKIAATPEGATGG